MLPPFPTCHTFLGSRFSNFSFPYVLLVIHSAVWLFIHFIANLPMLSPDVPPGVTFLSFFASFFFLLPRVYQYRLGPPCSDYHIASYPPLLCYSQTSPFPFSSDVDGAILVFRCMIGPGCTSPPISLLLDGSDHFASSLVVFLLL